MIAIFAFSFVVSLCLSLFLMLRGRAHAARYALDMPQRFHKGHVPRLGGVAIALACVAAWVMTAVAPWFGLRINVVLGWQNAGLWACALAPLVLAGVYEDVSQRLGVRWRLGPVC